MAIGHVYIFLNAAMPGMLKIGKTTRSPEERAKEVSQGTGVAAPFIVAYSEAVPDCDAAESLIHSRLAHFRVNRGREFFHMELRAAILELREISEEVRKLQPVVSEPAIEQLANSDEVLCLDSSLSESETAPSPGPPVGIETWKNEWAFGLSGDGSTFYFRSLLIGETAARAALRAHGCIKIGAPDGFVSEWDLLQKLRRIGCSKASRLRDFETIEAARTVGLIPNPPGSQKCQTSSTDPDVGLRWW